MKNTTLIAILTCKAPEYIAKAAMQKRTWVPLVEEAGYDVRAFTGEDLGVPDDYISLPLKTRAVCKWALGHGYKEMLKTDDDSCLNAKNLKPVQEDYAAGLICPPNDLGMPSRGCPSLPRGMTKFSYGSGGGYWLSERSIRLVADAPPSNDWAEDRWVGQVLGKAGIKLHKLDNRLTPPWLNSRHQSVPYYTLITPQTVAVEQVPGGADGLLECHEIMTGARPQPAFIPPPPLLPPRPAQIIMPTPLPEPQRPQARLPQPPRVRPVPPPPPRPDWQDTILGSKVNHAIARGFRVAAVCAMGSVQHMQLRRTMPGYLEEMVETPHGRKVLFLIK